MRTKLVEDLFSRLEARGFTSVGLAPNETMGLTRDLVANDSLANLFDRMVSRREKLAALFATQDRETTRKAYDDVCKIVEVLRLIVDELAG